MYNLRAQICLLASESAAGNFVCPWFSVTEPLRRSFLLGFARRGGMIGLAGMVLSCAGVEFFFRFIPALPDFLPVAVFLLGVLREAEGEGTPIANHHCCFFSRQFGGSC